jgi:1-phosphatidylinositol-3-phosphate 5-kinase
MFHLRIMLRQMLTIEKIPNIKEWEETLLKLSLQIARELTFTALPHHQGEDMDVRRYVKIKKIPGGCPSDSEYVDGAVITKNVAHKQMSRLQKNPRVMLVTFPLEFYRVEGQYMHFGQIVRQEKEYLGNLASRIAGLRPHVVLVEKSVSRLALDALAQHNIAVARTVKPSAIQFVARMTQADVFSSMDRLALEPRLGHCSKFRIETYDHALIPGRRKTYMRFEGCSRDMGCTIILRGGDIETLRRIKKVTRFLTFIVRNLKLETHLWKDSVITVPNLTPDAVPPTTTKASSGDARPAFVGGLMVPSVVPSISTPQVVVCAIDLPDDAQSSEDGREASITVVDEDLPDEDAERLRLSRRIHQSLEPYKHTFISVSATLRFPLPQPIRRMKELDEELSEAKRAWEDEIVRREEKGHHHRQEATITPTTTTTTNGKESIGGDHDDVKSQIEALTVPELPRTPTPRPPEALGKVEGDGGYFSPRPGSSSTFSLGQGSGFLMPSPLASPRLIEESPIPLTKASDIALESRLSYVQWQHEEQRRIWEWYLRKNKDDFVVEKYQNISIWEYIIPIAEFGLYRACFAPRLKYVTFYGENDCTLGQFIEKSVTDTLVQFLDPKAICAGKGCGQPLARHCKVFIHNETRLFVAVEQWEGLIKGRAAYPSPDLITTWSACRVCGMATPFIPVSEEMQRYSFAKFLELYFYPADVQLVQGAGCQHNIYQHHIRYFASKGMTVRFQADPVVIHEVVYPPMRIRVRPETQLELKNFDLESLHRKNIIWYTALEDDLKMISIDAATGNEEDDTRLLADINTLIKRAEVEKEEISRLINDIYKESSSMDTLALNQVRSYRQDKIVAWQQDFDRLPKPRATQTVDRHGRRVSAFGSVRAMWPGKYGLGGAFDQPNMPSFSVSEAEEGNVGMRRVTGDSFASSASDASEPEAESTSTELPAQASAPTSSSENLTTPSTEGLPLVLPSVLSSVTVEQSKSDAESDSTIGAGREEAVLSDRTPLSPLQVSNSHSDIEIIITFVPGRASKAIATHHVKHDVRGYRNGPMIIQAWLT